MNPYYRCFQAADGFLAVACLNVAQRRALLERIESAGVRCGVVQTRESVADPQVVATGLVGEVDQPGLGVVRLLAPFVRVGDDARGPTAAPELGADTESVLGELE